MENEEVRGENELLNMCEERRDAREII